MGMMEATITAEKQRLAAQKQRAEYACQSDGKPHAFVFLRNRTEEVGYRKWADVDTFFCSKCLLQRETKNEKPQPQRSGAW